MIIDINAEAETIVAKRKATSSVDVADGGGCRKCLGQMFFRVLHDRAWHVKPASSVFEAEGKVGCLVGLALRSVQALTELPLA